MVRQYPPRLRLLSRRSALAVLQARLVEEAVHARWPSITTELMARSSAGDRDRRTELWKSEEKGLFTADLSQAVVDGEADAVVHSWKDLPIAGHADAAVVATLERADPRDVLVVRRGVANDRPASLTVLSSSPRRAWQIRSAAPLLLPWAVTDVRVISVRGNVPTRLTKLVNGDGDALIVAKAALDRLLTADAPGEAAGMVRSALDRCRWMVLPLKAHPTAPGQGALAIEVAKERADLIELFESLRHEPTWAAVHEERRILESFGGGCNEAVGATVLPRQYGRITSVRARVGEAEMDVWSLESSAPLPPKASVDEVWPREDERARATRRLLDVPMPDAGADFWIARAEALPETWTPATDRIVWAAGTRTWERLARRGVWVNGCSDGLGDEELSGVEALAGRPVRWLRLTHADAGDPEALATYVVSQEFPEDIGRRTQFFWTSGSAFRRALERHPGLRGGWHASGPGRTARVIRETLGEDARYRVWLDYDQWLQYLTS